MRDVLPGQYSSGEVGTPAGSAHMSQHFSSEWPLLCRSAGVALTLCVFQKQVQAGVCVGMEVVTDALEQLRGAVLIVYPMGLPPHDPIRMELEDKEDLSGTHVSSNVFPLYVILG